MPSIRTNTTRRKAPAAPRAKILSVDRSQVEHASPYCGLHSAALVEFLLPLAPAGLTRGRPRYRRFWVLLHGAYNAMGLIGTECNGVAVLDEDRKQVLADRLAPATGFGWYGGTGGSPSEPQLAMFKHLTTCSWNQFRNQINCSGRNRYTLED